MTGTTLLNQPKEAVVQAGNVVIRTNPRWDGMVKHLGYESVDATPDIHDKRIMTDRELIQDSQERLSRVKIVPDERLTRVSLTHITLARELTWRVCNPIPPSGIHAARIPPASERTRTAGLYSTMSAAIYIDLEQLPHCSRVMDTLVHELAHHRQYRETGEASDLTPLHYEAMKEVASQVVTAIGQGELDEFFKEVVW